MRGCLPAGFTHGLEFAHFGLRAQYQLVDCDSAVNPNGGCWAEARRYKGRILTP